MDADSSPRPGEDPVCFAGLSGYWAGRDCGGAISVWELLTRLLGRILYARWLKGRETGMLEKSFAGMVFSHGKPVCLWLLLKNGQRIRGYEVSPSLLEKTRMLRMFLTFSSSIGFIGAIQPPRRHQGKAARSFGGPGIGSREIILREYKYRLYKLYTNNKYL